MDYSLVTNITVYTNDPTSLIPQLLVSTNMKGVYYQDNILACNSDGDCKRLPLGHTQWIDIQSFEKTRSGMAMSVVDGKVIVSCGKNSSCKKLLFLSC